ncbi:MAG: hypothetical protein HDS85_06475 [Bacteroidales bacterium]|nr:hypothetical protein [Bacteroidales bacterium]
MNTKEKHVRENERQDNENLLANGKNRKRTDTGRTNRLWLWLGVIVLIFILLYWLFAFGTFEDLMNVFNG